MPALEWPLDLDERWKSGGKDMFSFRGFTGGERGLCVFFSFFFPFGRGEWIGGHPRHLCKLFLAKKDESRRMLKGLLFVHPVKHSAGQIFFSP